MELADNQLLLVNSHIVTKVVKSQLIVGHIGNVTGIGLLTLLGGHAVQYDADAHSHKTIDLSHPLRVTLGQIIVDRDDVDTAPFKGVEVSGHGCHQGLAFTGTHLGNASLVQDDAADQLHAEGLHVKCTARALADCRIGLHQKVIQRLAILKSLSELLCLAAQFLISQGLHLGTECLNPVNQRADPLDLALTVRPEQFVC